MQVVGGGVLTGGAGIGISGALVGRANDTGDSGPESGPVGGCTRVGVGVKVGVDVGLWVGLLVGLCFGCTGRFTTELPGVSVAVGEGVAVGVGVSVGVAVGGTPSTVKRIALFATTVSVSPILAITSALIVYPDSPRSGHDPGYSEGDYHSITVVVWGD